MTYTDFGEFRKLFKRIPNERVEYVKFIEIRVNGKLPLYPFKNPKNHLNYYEIKKVMGRGGNIGVIALPKGLMFLDIDTDDNGDMLTSSEILKMIPDTFIVRSRSGGLHFYFNNEGEYNNQTFKIDGVKVGELRTNWQYVLSCGSWVFPAMYKAINDCVISDFKGEITKFFKKGVVEEKPVSIRGVAGRKITDADRVRIGHAELGTEDRRKEILAKLKARYGR